MENYIVSYVILPHGITDLTQVTIQELPLLMMMYLMSLTSCAIFHEMVQYGHLIFFLIASMIHFTQDFRYMKVRPIYSILLGSNVVLIPMILLYYDLLWLAKVFLIIYMVTFHVPLHYHRIGLKRRDIIYVLICTFIFGIIGPTRLKMIEEDGVEGMDSILACGMVVGHVTWHL